MTYRGTIGDNGLLLLPGSQGPLGWNQLQRVLTVSLKTSISMLFLVTADGCFLVR